MSKFHFSFLKICKFLRYFDLYGQSINLFVSKKKKFCTVGSGIISIIIIVLIFEDYKSLISSWLNHENMTLIPSEVSHSITELLAKKESISYQLDYTNYYVFFAMRVGLPDGSFVQPDLRRYVTSDFSYLNQFGKVVPLKTEACKIKYQDVYLRLNEETIKNDENKTNSHYLCIGDQLELGLYPDMNKKILNMSVLYFSIYHYQCVLPSIFFYWVYK